MTTKSPEVPATFVWLAVLAIVLAFGALSCMDYFEGPRRARGRSWHWKLLCRPSVLDLHGRSP
jgi:hypothetical protein